MYKELSIIIVITAAVYWYVTGHAIPAYLGFALALMVHESLRLFAAIFSALIMGFCGYYFATALPELVARENILQFPVGFAYMLVAFIRGYYTVN